MNGAPLAWLGEGRAVLFDRGYCQNESVTGLPTFMREYPNGAAVEITDSHGWEVRSLDPQGDEIDSYCAEVMGAGLLFRAMVLAEWAAAAADDANGPCMDCRRPADLCTCKGDN